MCELQENVMPPFCKLKTIFLDYYRKEAPNMKPLVTKKTSLSPDRDRSAVSE